MHTPLSEIADSFFKPAVASLVPYEPGKPVEEVQRELGLERVVKLASNEGPYGPFPAAVEAIERSIRELNRYPDGGIYRLRMALAERLGVRYEQVTVGAGSDGLVDCLTQLALDSGDEIVCGWPSFPSYVIDARKVGATPVTVPLRDGRYDLEAMLDSVTPRTKIVYICHPNNPTGTMSTRDELDDWFDLVPDHVLTVLDQAYHEYVDDPGLRRRGGGVPQVRAARRRAADVLEDLRARRAADRLRDRAGRDRHGDRQGAARLRRDDTGAGGRAREPRRRRRARSGGARRTGAAGRRSRRRCGRTASSRSGRRSGTSSSPRRARTTRGRCSRRSCARA